MATTKPQSKSDPQTAAIDAVVGLVEIALPFRSDGSAPTLDVIARLASQSSKLLRLPKETVGVVTNSATLQLMRKHDMIAS